MKKLEAPEVVGLLIEYGRRAQLAGGNPYRARAYIRAAESLAAQTEPLERLVAKKRLREIPGIGEAIAGVIEQLHRTDSHPSLEKMRGESHDHRCGLREVVDQFVADTNFHSTLASLRALKRTLSPGPCLGL